MFNGQQVDVSQIQSITLKDGSILQNQSGGNKEENQQKYYEFYEEFYKKFPDKKEGFMQFFTYVPSIDKYLMENHAKGEYSTAFCQLYDAWKDKLPEDSIEDMYEIKSDEEQNDVDFTKPQPQEKIVLEECFNKEPSFMINLRNEKLVQQDKGGAGKLNSEDTLILQQLSLNQHISLSHDFINDYIGGSCGYQMQKQRDDRQIMNKTRKLRRYSKQKSRRMKGGFSDTNIQPIREDNTYTTTYQAPAITVQPEQGLYQVDNKEGAGKEKEQQEIPQQEEIPQEIDVQKKRRGKGKEDEEIEESESSDISVSDTPDEEEQQSMEEIDFIQA